MKIDKPSTIVVVTNRSWGADDEDEDDTDEAMAAAEWAGLAEAPDKEAPHAGTPLLFSRSLGLPLLCWCQLISCQLGTVIITDARSRACEVSGIPAARQRDLTHAESHRTAAGFCLSNN